MGSSSYSSVLARLALTLGCIALGACADDEGPCPKPREDCNIAEPSCQRQVFAATACIRGQRGAKVPPIRVITREEYADELRAEDVPEEDFGAKVWGKALGLYGMVPRDQSIQESDVAQRVASIAAFYRRDTKAVTIISDTSMDAKRAVLTLSHEFVHSLQDQREGLVQFYEKHATNSDANAALKSLTEGEAVVLSNLTVLHLRGGGPDDVDWDEYFGGWLMRELGRTSAAAAPLLAARSLVYPVGGAGVYRAFAERGLAGIRSYYVDPPHTFRHWVTQGEAPRDPDSLRCAPPIPPQGFELKYLDSHGVTGLVALSVGLGLGARYEEAAAWTSDGFAVYADPDESSEEVAVSWRLRFTSVEAAAQLAAFASEAGLGIEAHQYGDEIALASATDPALLEAWEERFACGDADTEKTRARAQKRPTLVPPLLRAVDEAAHHNH